MSRKIRYSGYSSLSLTPSVIYGSNLFAEYDPAGISGVHGDPVTTYPVTAGTYGKNFTAGSGQEPTLDLNTFNFPSLSTNKTTDFMTIAGSSADFNFMHFGGGTLITVFQPKDLNPSDLQFLVGTNIISAGRGYAATMDDRSGVSNSILSATYLGSSGTLNSSFNQDETYVPQKINSLVNNLDPQNSTVSERNKVSYNGSALISDILTATYGAASSGNSTNDMTLFKNPASNTFYANCYLFYLAFIDRKSTNQEIQKVNLFLQDKFGNFPIN